MAIPWVLAGVAVLLLRVGYALYLGGIARSKNTVSTLFRAIVEISVGILAFWLLGGAIIRGSWQTMAGLENGPSFFVGTVFLLGPAIVGGATLERGRIAMTVAAAILLPGVLCPVVCRVFQWKWLMDHGFMDQSGAVYIHFAAGLAALVAAMAVGPRSGKYNHDGSTNAIFGHNLPLVASGVLIMFVMWIPYVAGFATDEAAACNTLLAGAAAVVAAVIYCMIRYGRSDVFLVMAGLLGGLVTMTAGADHFNPALAALTGAVAGMIVPYAVVQLDLVCKIDDPAGGIAIHGLGGLWGAMAVGLFAPGLSVGERMQRLGVQCAGLLAAGVVAVVLSALVFYLMRATIGVRVAESSEIEGLDLSEHDLNAYPDFQQTMIKSYHLREM